MRRHGLLARRRWVTASLAIEAARDAARSKRQLLERIEEPRTMTTVDDFTKIAEGDPIAFAKTMLGGL